MRIISQDGTRDFPYEEIALVARILTIDSQEIYSINAIFNNKEYELAYYSDGEVALNIMQEIRSTPHYMPCEEEYDYEDDDFYTNETEILFIKLPTQEEVDEIYGE